MNLHSEKFMNWDFNLFLFSLNDEMKFATLYIFSAFVFLFLSFFIFLCNDRLWAVGIKHGKGYWSSYFTISRNVIQSNLGYSNLRYESLDYTIFFRSRRNLSHPNPPELYERPAYIFFFFFFFWRCLAIRVTQVRLWLAYVFNKNISQKYFSARKACDELIVWEMNELRF